MNSNQITTFLLLISLLTLTRPSAGGLETENESESTSSMSELLQNQPIPCPTECFCNPIDHVITCVGDKLKSSLPIFTWLHKNSRKSSSYTNSTGTLLRHLEIRDFVLPELNFETSQEEAEEDSFESSSLFQFVQELSLSHNQIKAIHSPSTQVGRPESESYFNNTGKSSISLLLLLDLSSNNLTSFCSREEFQLLKILDLSHNKISKLTLHHLQKLESLNLKSNHIEELNEDIFQSLKSIQYINLDSNLLKKLSPNLFSNLPSLAHLILSSNPLKLGTGFLFNSRTQFIDISNVGLQNIPSVMFRTVRDLRLNNNKLKRILESDFESYPNVGLLVLDENQIETIENDAFGRLEFLTSLWLNGNRLLVFPQNLPRSLKSLHLEENRISTLNSTSFIQLENLETLNLHINLINSLEPEVLSSLYNLRSLNIGSNQIDTIYQDTFKNLSKLTHLDLSQNPIKVIVVRAFTHFPKLQSLHLARINEKEIEFDPSILDSQSLVQILDLSNSKYLTNKIIETNVLGRGWLKSLRELNIERCDLTIGLDMLCSQLYELDSLVNVKVQGNSFNRTSTSNSNSSVILRQVVTSNTSTTSSTVSTTAISSNADNSGNENDDNEYDGSGDNLYSLKKLCPSSESRNEASNKSQDKFNKTTSFATTTTTAVSIEQGDETSFVESREEKKTKKVSLTLTTTAKNTTTESPLVIISSKVTPTTRRNRPSSRSPTKSSSRSAATKRKQMTTANTKKIQGKGRTSSTTTKTSTTSSPVTSTSSYFEATKKSLAHVESNENVAVGGNRDSTSTVHKKKKEGSIDGFPADLSGQTSSMSRQTGRKKSTSSNNSNSSTTSSVQEHSADFAKGSFHGLLPQKMYLSQSPNSAAEEDENGERRTPSTSLILKTIFISAGTCLLSVFILLAFGLVLFRINGGRFVRHATTSNETPLESYKRLEDKQEMELGFSNKMYYEGGQVYHIS